MTPKEKANEIVNNIHTTLLRNDHLQSYEASKQCALIAVDEIFEFMKMDDEYTGTVYNANSKWVNYFQEVKNEIKKL